MGPVLCAGYGLGCGGLHKHKVRGAAMLVTDKTLLSEPFFLRLAYYEQANFLLAASISRAEMWGLVKKRDPFCTPTPSVCVYI